MDAIPCAIYTAPTSVFRTDIVKCISDNEQACYFIQLLHRVNYQSYTVLVASSCDDLLALHCGDADEATQRHVLVSTISRQDLHRHCALILAPQAEAPLYAAPAALLADKDLLIASSAWLTYFRVVRGHADGSVSVRLAGLPHRVETDGAYTTTLTTEEFAQALPLSRRELALATCDLLELVEAHAESVTGRPVEHIAPAMCPDDEEDTEHTPTRIYPPEVLAMVHIEDEEQPDKQQNTTPLHTEPVESVYVPAEIAAGAIQQFSKQTGKLPLSRKFQQQVWLRAALLAIKLYQTQSGSQQALDALALQDERLRAVLVNWLSPGVRLVEIEPVGQPSGPPQRAVYRGYIVRVELPKIAA